MAGQTANKKAETRGRKKKDGERTIIQFKLYLWEGEDDDLLAFFEGLPPRQRSAAIKLALRSGSALSDLQSTHLEEDEDDMDFDMGEFLT
jgi:hypothetical protein